MVCARFITMFLVRLFGICGPVVLVSKGLRSLIERGGNGEFDFELIFVFISVTKT